MISSFDVDINLLRSIGKQAVKAALEEAFDRGIEVTGLQGGEIVTGLPDRGQRREETNHLGKRRKFIWTLYGFKKKSHARRSAAKRGYQQTNQVA